MLVLRALETCPTKARPERAEQGFRAMASAAAISRVDAVKKKNKLLRNCQGGLPRVNTLIIITPLYFLLCVYLAEDEPFIAATGLQALGTAGCPGHGHPE